jgi:Zn-dependent metalloprotease
MSRRAGLRHHPVHCIVPPYLLERLAQSRDRAVRLAAIENLQLSAQMRGKRAIVATMPAALLKYAAAAPTGPAKKRREVYDQGGKNPPDSALPGKLVRSEGQPKRGDAAADEAYEHSGATWDFYWKVFQRNSLDDAGMTLVSSVHAGSGFDNAFWNGLQMVYGDGDGVVFRRFTRSLDVVGHELSHGVVQHTCALEYEGEAGALNEHFADVFGMLVRQFRRKETAAGSDWLVGREILVPAATRKAIRSFADPGTAFRDDPYLGDDPQPNHYARRYKGSGDNGGVHINSGIPNHAFYLAATAVGGSAWDPMGRVWYKVMLNLQPTSDFADCANEARAVAAQIFGGEVARAVDAAWAKVGL